MHNCDAPVMRPFVAFSSAFTWWTHRFYVSFVSVFVCFLSENHRTSLGCIYSQRRSVKEVELGLALPPHISQATYRGVVGLVKTTCFRCKLSTGRFSREGQQHRTHSKQLETINNIIPVMFWINNWHYELGHAIAQHGSNRHVSWFAESCRRYTVLGIPRS